MSVKGRLGGSVVKRLTLDFTSGRDLTVQEIKPWVGSHADSMEAAWNSLSPSLSLSLSLSSLPPSMCARSLSLSPKNDS